MKTRLTNEIVDFRLIRDKRTVQRIGNVITSKHKIEWKCLKCDNHWFAILSNVLNQDANCPNCSYRHLLTHKEVDERLIIRKIKRLDEYIDSHTKHNWKCVKELDDGSLCNYIWNTTFHSIINTGRGCSKCSNNVRLTDVIIDERLLNRKRHIQRIDSIVGKNNKSILKWKCLRIKNEKVCEYIWEANSGDVLNKESGCPKCKTYKGEEELDRVLEEIQIISTVQKKFEDLRSPESNYYLRFDRYLPEFNCCVEFHGPQHYSPPKKIGKKFFTEDEAIQSFINLQYRDKIKEDYCKINNIKLIIISFKQMKKMKQLLEFELCNYGINYG